MTPLTITSMTQGRLVHPADWRKRLGAEPPQDQPDPRKTPPPLAWLVRLAAVALRRPA